MSTDLAALVGAIGDAGIDTTDTVFVAPPREAMIIRLRAGPKFDNLVLETLGLPAKSVACFAPGATYSGYQDVPQIETRNEVALHFEDTAPAEIVGSPGTVAAPVKSLFQMEIIAIRVRANAAWAVAPGGAQIVENVNW